MGRLTFRTNRTYLDKAPGFQRPEPTFLLDNLREINTVEIILANPDGKISFTVLMSAHDGHSRTVGEEPIAHSKLSSVGTPTGLRTMRCG